MWDENESTMEQLIQWKQSTADVKAIGSWIAAHKQHRLRDTQLEKYRSKFNQNNLLNKLDQWMLSVSLHIPRVTLSVTFSLLTTCGICIPSLYEYGERLSSTLFIAECNAAQLRIPDRTSPIQQIYLTSNWQFPQSLWHSIVDFLM